MRPNIAAGEIGISTPFRDYIFRPSLSAIASIGSPSEIVEIFATLHAAPKINPFYPVESFRRWERSVFSASHSVLSSCCDDETVIDLIGHCGSRYGSWVSGAIPFEDMPHLARALMRHGVIGLKPEGRPIKKPEKEEYSKEFNARDFVAQAVAHLGMSSAEAWNLTMTEFSGAMQAKFGKPETLPPVEEHDDAMARLAEINRLRQYQVKK